MVDRVKGSRPAQVVAFLPKNEGSQKSMQRDGRPSFEKKNKKENKKVPFLKNVHLPSYPENPFPPLPPTSGKGGEGKKERGWENKNFDNGPFSLPTFMCVSRYQKNGDITIYAGENP